jgi:hypothetical protein
MHVELDILQVLSDSVLEAYITMSTIQRTALTGQGGHCYPRSVHDRHFRFQSVHDRYLSESISILDVEHDLLQIFS